MDEILYAVSNALKTHYVLDDDPWANSPFAWIKTKSSRQIGKIGEELVSYWCMNKGFKVQATYNSEADLCINNRLIEVKFSTLWTGGTYTFQQIRDQNYEFAFFLGISPNETHAWFIPKTVLYDYVIGHIPQHTGKGGTDTFWLHVEPNNPPQWMNKFGGTMDKAFSVMKKLI